MGLEHIEDILHLSLRGKPGDSLDLPGGYTAYKKYSTFVITSDEPVVLEDRTMEAEGRLDLQEVRKALRVSMTTREEAESIAASPNRTRAVLDADKAPFPILVRSRREGDRFCPQGMEGKSKKLQDFLVDAKVPRFERGEVPLVVVGDDIAWVAGQRADERFSPSAGTSRFLLLELL